MKRVCSKCSTEYEHYGQKCSLCKPCRREYDRVYHAQRSKKAKQRKQKKQKERIRDISQKIRDHKASIGCQDCGEIDPIVLDFDHVSDDKEHNIADMLRHGHRCEKILVEIEKCEVVCSNCHRRRTHKRLNTRQPHGLT